MYVFEQKTTDFGKSAPDGVVSLTNPNPRETCWLGGRNSGGEPEEDRHIHVRHKNTRTQMMKGFVELNEGSYQTF